MGEHALEGLSGDLDDEITNKILEIFECRRVDGDFFILTSIDIAKVVQIVKEEYRKEIIPEHRTNLLRDLDSLRTLGSVSMVDLLMEDVFIPMMREWKGILVLGDERHGKIVEQGCCAAGSASLSVARVLKSSQIKPGSIVSIGTIGSFSLGTCGRDFMLDWKRIPEDKEVFWPRGKKKRRVESSGVNMVIKKRKNIKF